MWQHWDYLEQVTQSHNCCWNRFRQNLCYHQRFYHLLYSCWSLPPNHGLAHWWFLLLSTHHWGSNQKHLGLVVLTGDFNSHVGPECGLKASDSQNFHGRLLLEMVHNNNLFISALSNLSSGPLFTYFRENTQTTTDCVIVVVWPPPS